MVYMVTELLVRNEKENQNLSRERIVSWVLFTMDSSLSSLSVSPEISQTGVTFSFMYPMNSVPELLLIFVSLRPLEYQSL